MSRGEGWGSLHYRTVTNANLGTLLQRAMTEARFIATLFELLLHVDGTKCIVDYIIIIVLSCSVPTDVHGSRTLNKRFCTT